MDRIAKQLRTFVSEEDGAAIAEYGLLLAIVAVGMITVLTAFRDKLGVWWKGLQDSLTATPTSAP